MYLKQLSLKPYSIEMKHGGVRNGVILCIIDEEGRTGEGDIAPLPKWSQETLNQSIEQVKQKSDDILKVEWNLITYRAELKNLELHSSVLFGLESALLSILAPIVKAHISTSALFMGSPDEILKQAALKKKEGYISAKLKVGHLSFQEAAFLIQQLKDDFRLRIDVNRAWTTFESLHFFDAFALNTFDYVEEPFQNPQDLGLFLHPLAVDESFPSNLTLENLETFPTLKALIYKPTIQGGMLNCLRLHEWTKDKGISLVLSSAFESPLGLQHIAAMAQRLNLCSPVGVGTDYFLKGNTFRSSAAWEFGKITRASFSKTSTS
jgi:o-succinylbenzoate synthase